LDWIGLDWIGLGPRTPSALECQMLNVECRMSNVRDEYCVRCRDAEGSETGVFISQSCTSLSGMGVGGKVTSTIIHSIPSADGFHYQKVFTRGRVELV
jgi:hypothetical protein